MKYVNFISVDLQRYFTDPEGKAYKRRSSVDFVRDTLIPYFRANKLKVAEIVSDYRQPRPGDRGDCCWPGTPGYESIITNEIKKSVWVKCMNSPIWTRDNIGDPDKEPGIPRQDGQLFQKWLDNNIGEMNIKTEVVLFGLTSDCCVLSTAQELNWRGYKVFILKEAVDNYSGDPIEKGQVLKSPMGNWAKTITWQDIIV